MIFFLYGPDTFRSREKLKFYKEGFKKKYDPKGFNIEVLDGEKLTTDDFRKKMESRGLLSKKRLVIVEGITKNKKKKIQEEVAEYLKENPLGKSDILIFWEADLGEKRKKGKLVKAAKGELLDYLGQEARIEEFERLSGEKLKHWVLAAIRKNKGAIKPDALNLLLALVGDDLWQMDNEIKKLTSHRVQGTIIREDVASFVRAKYDTDIFKLSDALAERKTKEALKLIHDQISSGENELYLLTMLTRQFKILLQVKEAQAVDHNYYTIASRLKLHPFVVQKALAQVRHYTPQELKQIFNKLLEIDIKIKTSQADPKLLFDLFIMEVCR